MTAPICPQCGAPCVTHPSAVYRGETPPVVRQFDAERFLRETIAPLTLADLFNLWEAAGFETYENGAWRYDARESPIQFRAALVETLVKKL